MARTMSLMVALSFLPVSFTSANASVAVANMRSGVMLWFMNVGGGVNGMVSSGGVVREPLDEVHLPQRAVAIQRSAADLADRLVELAAPARGGQLERPDVVGAV